MTLIFMLLRKSFVFIESSWKMDYRSNHSNKMNFQKNDDFCRDARKYAREYCEVTSIQGFRFLAEKRSLVEKIFWIVIVLVALAGCSYMIYEIVWKYQNSPVVVNFATKETPIYEIPFPAVTICPESKCAGRKFNYTEKFIDYVILNKTLSEEDLKTLHYMSLLCDEERTNTSTPIKNKTVGEDFFSHIEKYKPEPYMFCNFMDENDDLNSENCKGILTPIITDRGICYSFNILDRNRLFRKDVSHYADYYQVFEDSDDFDGEAGYTEKAGVKTYPKRALMAGVENGFSLVFLHLRSDTDFICNQFLHGFRISVHDPASIPSLAKHFFWVPLNKIVLAAVEPQLVVPSEAVRKFHPNKRQCYLHDERYLKYFKIYTQSNCMLECVTNYTLAKCGCVDYFMPRENTTAICGYGNSKCLFEAQNTLKIKELESKISGKDIDTDCDCKPLCTELKFEVETSHSDLHWEEFANLLVKEEITEVLKQEMHISMLTVYIKREQFTTLEKNELYGVSDLISNFGGLLGLFTGFSLISLAELIYFLTLRIYYNVKLYGSWSGPEN